MFNRSPIWKDSNRTYVWAFNVERGLSVFVRLPNNLGILYDLGCSPEFSPVEFIEDHFLPHLTKYDEKNPLAQLIVSHPHHDHIQEASKVNESVELKNFGLITLPHFLEVEGRPEERLKRTRIVNDDNEDFILEYEKLYDGRKPPLQSLDPARCPATTEDCQVGIYYMRPPEVSKLHPLNDHHYGNGVSIGFYLKHNQHSLWIAGDITPEVHKKVLLRTDSVEARCSLLASAPEGIPGDYHSRTTNQPSPGELFGEHGLTLFFAPHHGLESCFCQDAFDLMKGGKPRLNVICDKRHTGEHSGTIDERYSKESHSSGTWVDVEGKQEFRRRISTQSGRHMLFILGGPADRPKVFSRKNAEDLINLK